MSINEQFDELARQKLEARAFPFDEAAWQRAQQSIAVQGRRRRKPIWFAGGAVAVGLALWLLWPRQQEPLVAEQRNTEVRAEARAEKPELNATGMQASSGTEPEEAARTTRPASEPESNGQTGSVALDLGEPDARPRPGREARKQQMATVDIPNMPEAAEMHQYPPVLVIEHNGSEEPLPPSVVEEEPKGDPELSLVRKDDPEAAEVTIPVLAKEGGEQVGSDDPLNTERAGEAVVEDALEGEGSAWNESVMAERTKENLAKESATTSEPEAMRALTKEDAPSEAAQVTTPVDSLINEPAVVTAALPNDSAVGPLPDPALGALVGPRSPWELSMLAGAFSTSSKYVLPQVREWSSAPERTTGFAAEAVRMGRNFGYGAGLHYGTYADRLSTPEETRTQVDLSRYWFLQGVDTTILIITGGDSASGYTGINVNTTVQVLRSAFDTTTTTAIVRPARTQLVRTSYVELPLLLDAHLVQGRWSIGVRGGPTIGMLTSRSGALPSGSEGGYTDLDQSAVRQTIYGWTARAYLRYRFNSAWSIGLEPAARGQLIDAFDEQGARRRSTALGAMLSLSYRMR
ncbi:MAG: hypothetical protein JNM49_08250 [Flavobacteriales bacterium]|nr:hypothetical protein [Flavobacteriales bacterium]